MSTTVPADPITTIQEVYAAFARGDVPAILSRSTGDVEFTFAGASPTVPWHGPWRGHDGLVGFFTRIAERVTFDEFAPLAFTAGGDAVAVRLRLRYRVNATGRAVDEEQVHWWTLRDGRVSGLTHFEDTAQVIAAAR